MQTPAARTAVTVAYAAAYGLIALSYVVAPPARIARPGVVSIARYIDGLGPVWSLGFGLVAVVLVVTLATRRGEWLAHSFAAAVIAGYGAASMLSGFLSEAFYGSPTAFVCLATTVLHLALARRYQTTTSTGRHKV